MAIRKWNIGYNAPSDLNQIVKNSNELAQLHYFIQLDSGCSVLHPGIRELRLGIMSLPTAQKTKDALVSYGYITEKVKKFPEANEYKVNYDAINHAIQKARKIKDLGKRAAREYSQAERNAMTVRNCMLNPELAHKAEKLLGNKVLAKVGGKDVDIESGEILDD